MNAFPGLLDTEADAGISYLFLCYFKERAEITVRETVQLSLFQHVFSRNCALVCKESFLLVNKLLHLLDEVLLYLCKLVELVNCSTLAESLIHNELSLAGGVAELSHELVLSHFIEILSESKAVSVLFKAADSLLEGFLISLAYTHYLADSSHLSAQLVLSALELLECPASELDNDVVAVGIVLVQSAVLTAGDLIKSKSAGQHSRNQCYREACSL